MGLSIPQMRRMSRLLDEALPLDATGRRAWLEALPTDDRDLAEPLRCALLPGEAELAQLEKLTTLAWPECGWRGVPMVPSNEKWL